MKGVKDFLRIHAVPQELGERVIDYITSSWSVNKGIDTAKVSYTSLEVETVILLNGLRITQCYEQVKHEYFKYAAQTV
ncbi:hypothetical protein AHF37_12022 [Paragonimus kellicotti]|nr:hypothetical protein AHF37_12022 [Paragonimus kellicotti]